MDDLLDVIGRDTRLRRVASTHGGEYAGPCPLPGCSSDTDALRVWPEHEGGRWWCRKCGRGGDLIAYQVERGTLTKGEAYKARHGDELPPSHVTAARTPAPRLPVACDPPNATWQARAFDLVAIWQAALWADEGTKARAWLHGRGLSDDTIQRAGLGYNGADVHEDRALWGLPEGKQVWLPRGIAIPWFVGADLWRVNIRRPKGDPKYIGPAGCGVGLYEADGLTPGADALMCEGELDALTVHQVAGDLVHAVATGSTQGARRARWVSRLALCRRVLLAFDADKAGDEARAWWLDVLPNAATWRPYWNDTNAMHQDGGDVRGWVSAGLQQVAPVA